MSAGKVPIIVVVDRTAEEPVYEQIARQIRMRVAAGELPAGTPLPPVRVLASDLGCNPNTVARAYRLLENEGFVRIRDREGVQVAPPAAKADAEEMSRLLGALRALLARMRQAGAAPEELRAMIAHELEVIHEAPVRSARRRV